MMSSIFLPFFSLTLCVGQLETSILNPSPYIFAFQLCKSIVSDLQLVFIARPISISIMSDWVPFYKHHSIVRIRLWIFKRKNHLYYLLAMFYHSFLQASTFGWWMRILLTCVCVCIVLLICWGYTQVNEWWTVRAVLRRRPSNEKEEETKNMFLLEATANSEFRM